ncbi:hypothetical protein [Oryzihumus leptocrescens]|nr:hypothetical protein [Oryzihumus leptocrescens]
MATRDQQVGEVIEGLALGLAMLGFSEVPRSKLDFEFAISHAWRRWDHADAYPSIGRAPKPDNLLWIGLTKSAGRRPASFRFDRGDPFSDYRIVTPSWWSADEAEPVVGDRPNESWRALASLFAEWDGWKRK